MMLFSRRWKQPAPTSQDKAREPADEDRGGNHGPGARARRLGNGASRRADRAANVPPVAGLALMELGESPNHPLKMGRSVGRPTVTLSLEKDLIRVVAFQGTKVVAWGTAILEEHPRLGPT